MEDQDKSKSSLIEELSQLRIRVRNLEGIEKNYLELKEKILQLGMLIQMPETTLDPSDADDPLAATTVLVVDDNEIFREFIVNALTNYGYNVLAAGSSTEAIKRLEGSVLPVQLLIADVVMPGMSGSELYFAVKKIYPELKVLFMSGYTDDVLVHSDVQDVLESEMAFLQKPFLTEDLLKMVKQELTGSAG